MVLPVVRAPKTVSRGRGVLVRVEFDIPAQHELFSRSLLALLRTFLFTSSSAHLSSNEVLDNGARRHVRIPSSSWTMILSAAALHFATSSLRTSRTSNRFQRTRFVINSGRPGSVRPRCVSSWFVASSSSSSSRKLS